MGEPIGEAAAVDAWSVDLEGDSGFCASCGDNLDSHWPVDGATGVPFVVPFNRTVTDDALVGPADLSDRYTTHLPNMIGRAYCTTILELFKRQKVSPRPEAPEPADRAAWTLGPSDKPQGAAGVVYGVGCGGMRGRCTVDKAALGIAGVNTRPNQKAAIGIAGVDSKKVFKQAALGVSGVDRLPKAQMAIAGNWSSSIRPMMQDLVEKPPIISANRIGDRAALSSWQRAVYLSDYTYLVCTDPAAGVRWRSGFEEMFTPSARKLALYLDSAAFRRATGTAPKWNTYESYCRAIDLTEPEGYMAYDVMGDQAASLQGYQRMAGDGYGDRCIPVWQMGPAWDDRASERLTGWATATEDVRVAVANARIAAQNPVMRYYAERSHLIAIGGMVKGSCPRTARRVFLAELCRCMPDHQFWGLGQASQPVVNGLGQMGLLDKVWLDGSWCYGDTTSYM